MGAFPVTRVARKWIAFGGNAMEPGIDPPLTGDLVALLRGRHGNVLGQTGLAGTVGTDSMRELAVPDQQITGARGDCFDLQTGHVRSVWVAIGRLRGDPLRQPGGHARHTLESTLFRCGVRQAEDALHILTLIHI